MQVRSVTSDDLPFMRRALILAANWREAKAPDDTNAELERAGLSYLLESWGRRGDTGVVAEVDAEPLGAAWFRFWTRERHSYGFVDESIPEMAVAVEPHVRRRGIGTTIVSRLLTITGKSGVSSVSLSVEFGNPALRLYERLGFQRVGVNGNAWTMVVDLRR